MHIHAEKIKQLADLLESCDDYITVTFIDSKTVKLSDIVTIHWDENTYKWTLIN